MYHSQLHSVFTAKMRNMNKIVDQYEPVYIQGLWHRPLFKANQYEIMIYCHRPTVAIIRTI